ncbi:hypothetical protein [Paenibacillus sp. 1P03SA]|uniref:hypothetical protein n=1 Tax=Paenibacillus sp. 1P03SA TaxID=3132294 RepID=UPI0039A236E4
MEYEQPSLHEGKEACIPENNRLNDRMNGAPYPSRMAAYNGTIAALAASLLPSSLRNFEQFQGLNGPEVRHIREY